MHDLIRELREDNAGEDCPAGRRRPGRSAAGAGRQDRAGIGAHAEPRRLRARGRVRPEHPRVCRASRRAAGRATSACSATIRCNTASAAAFSKRWASISRSARATWPRAATSAPSTTTALISRPPRRPADDRTLRRHVQAAANDPRSRRRDCSSSRCASIASSSSSAATSSATPSTTPIRSRPATRRCRPRARTPASQKTADAVNRFVGRGGQGAQGPCADQHGDAARLRPLSEDRHHAGNLRPASGRHRRLSDVQGPGPPGRHGRARRRLDARRSGRDARSASGTSTTSSSCTTSTPTAPARTATSPAKVEMIERFDAEIPKIRALNPDVLIVTGDHSTPSKLKSHSWHPVPVVLVAKIVPDRRGDGVRRVAMPARRTRPVPGDVSDAAGDGPRRPAGQVRGVTWPTSSTRCVRVACCSWTARWAPNCSAWGCSRASAGRNGMRLAPNRVRAIHQRYVDAGADVLLTNTFQSNPSHLTRFGLDDRLEEINRYGAWLARKAAGRSRFVLADIGPILDSSGRNEFVDYKVLGRVLTSLDGADGFLFETCSSPCALTAVQYAFHRVAEVETPLLLSLSYIRSPTGQLVTFSGHAPETYARHAERHGVAALGVNCGRDIGMEDIIEIIRHYRRATDLPLFARPNAGTPTQQRRTLALSAHAGGDGSAAAGIARSRREHGRRVLRNHARTHRGVSAGHRCVESYRLAAAGRFAFS